MQIEKLSASHLDPTLRQDLKSRIDREFGHVPIVREHVWAEPDWAFLGYVDGELVSFLNLVDRNARADGNPVHLFGLNNVITEPQHRGHGYSTKLNQTAADFINELDKDACGFLFCADDLIPFYEKLGWKKYPGEVIISQPTGDKRWQSNAMIYSPAAAQSWQSVHLCGLPW